MSSVKKTFGSRKFYALPEEYAVKSSKFKPASKKEDVTKLIKYIEDSVIGKNTTFAGPYGRRKVVYCDYTASARSLQFIEEYILKEVLPAYGNTHTTTSLTSLQSTLFRHEARDIIRNAVHASEDDAVIFVGSGATGAVHKLIHALGFTSSNPPIVFAGPFEHHSNLLPWKEISAKIIRIQETKEGFLDLLDLENQLILHRNLQPDVQLIGVFSAASNITGVLADDVATTLLLHQYGALAFWDYATAAPYVPLDMNPFLPTVDEKSVYKDAMFFSGHKFVGGIQTPGVLVAKKALFKNPVPDGCGGGSVFFVSRESHRYLKDVETREEGGTGAIVESIRLGLAMQLKMYVGVNNIMTREEKITKQMLSFIRNIPEVTLLGNSSPTCSSKRLAVFSFLVKHPRGLFLHHNLVCAILNDVFGIQARGGCACAGPYAQDLLGIDEAQAKEYEALLLEDSRLDRHHLRRHGESSPYEMLRPGFTRLSLPYFMSEQEVAFVMEAVKMVATEGWKLLPQYVLNPETAEWRHSTNSIFRDRKWLGNVRYVEGRMTTNERKVSGQNPCPHDYNDILHTARNIFNKARKIAVRHPLADQRSMFNETSEALRWFMLPSEAQDLLLGHTTNVRQQAPFAPGEYSERLSSLPDLNSGFSRHNSLSALDIKIKNDKLNRNRSESPSPTTTTIANSHGAINTTGGPPTNRKAGVLSPVSPYYSRERCYSLGSNPETPRLKSSPYFARGPRTRQCSCGSQTDLNSIDSDRDACDSPNSTSENFQAYVEEVTKELTAEIKSEIREVINKVDDALSECSETSFEATLNGNGQLEKRFSLESRFIKSNSLPRNNSVPTIIMNNYDCYDSNRSIDSVGVSFKGFETPPLQPSPLNDSAMSEHVAEYLAELTTEMVTEMKSEFREMVNAVDEIICPGSNNSSTDSSSSCPGNGGNSCSPSGSTSCQRNGTSETGCSRNVRNSSSENVCHKNDSTSEYGCSRYVRNSADNVCHKNDSTSEYICSRYVRNSAENVCHKNEGTSENMYPQISSALDSIFNRPSSSSDSYCRGGSSTPDNVCHKSNATADNMCHKSNATADNVCHKSNATADNVCHKIRATLDNVCQKSSSQDGVNPKGGSHAEIVSQRSSSSDSASLGCSSTSCSSSSTSTSLTEVGDELARDGLLESIKEGDMDNDSSDSLDTRRGTFCSQDSGVYVSGEPKSARAPACLFKPGAQKSKEPPATDEGGPPVTGELKPRWYCPPNNIWRPSLKAIKEFDMIRDGDRVLVCVSGGKDSLSLLHTLHQYQYYARSKNIHFTLGAATVDPGSNAYDPRPLIPYMAALGVHYLYEEQPILEQAAATDPTSICSFCSRLKRGRLYAAARAAKYNVLALGQHLDDCAETFLMAVFHNGRLRSMKAHYYIRERDLRVIRPFINVREKALRQFAESKRLPVIPENCPACFEAPKERHRTKQLLAQQEILFPKLFSSLRSAIQPLVSFRYTGVESKVYSEGFPLGGGKVEDEELEECPPPPSGSHKAGDDAAGNAQS